MRRRNLYFVLGICSLLAMPCFSQSSGEPNAGSFEPGGQFFSVRLPSGWERSEMDLMQDFNQYSIKAYAPGFEDLGYVLIAVDYYGAAHRTPERFLYDLQPPAFGSVLAKTGETAIQIYGRKAVALTRKHTRSLILFDGTVAAEQRYVVIPAETGFFVLLYDAPENQFRNYLPVFDAVVASFQPKVEGNAAIEAKADESLPREEITAEDYAVITDFLNAGELLVSEIPYYFKEVFGVRTILDRSSLRTEWKKKVPEKLVETFGAGASVLFRDLQKNNAQEYQVKDRILISPLNILPQKNLSFSRMEEPGLMGGASDYLAFSRVGFNPAKTLALLYVGHKGNPITSYFVLMEKGEHRWVIRNVYLDQMLIQ